MDELKMSDNHHVYTAKELQTMLKISRSTVYKLLDEGCIKSIKIGSLYRIPRQAVIEYIESASTDATADMTSNARQDNTPLLKNEKAN